MRRHPPRRQPPTPLVDTRERRRSDRGLSLRLDTMLTRILRPTVPGRGGNFSRKRVVGEALAQLVYRQGWAARAWQRLPGRTEVDVIRHELALLPGAARRSLRIAFASDFHIGPLTAPRLLDNACARLAQMAPDVLVLGGDYV